MQNTWKCVGLETVGLVTVIIVNFSSLCICVFVIWLPVSLLVAGHFFQYLSQLMLHLCFYTFTLFLYSRVAEESYSKCVWLSIIRMMRCRSGLPSMSAGRS